jgi:lipopolysaccharide transport system permease protein
MESGTAEGISLKAMDEPRPVVVIRPPAWSDVWSVATRRQLRDFAHLFLELSRHRIDVRYKQSVLGPLWAVLQPLAMMGIFTFVFSRLVRMPSEGVPYALFAYSGLLPWTFFATSVSTGTNSLTSHAALVTKVAFPREILPATYVVAAFVDFLIASAVLLLLAMWFRVPLHWNLIFALPALAVLALLAFGVALVLSAIQVRVRDIGVALPIVLQFLMFASPVLYPLSAVPPNLAAGYVLNPLAGLIDGFRRSVLGGPLDLHAMAISVLWTAAVLPAAYAIFKRAERTMADVI